MYYYVQVDSPAIKPKRIGNLGKVQNKGIYVRMYTRQRLKFACNYPKKLTQAASFALIGSYEYTTHSHTHSVRTYPGSIKSTVRQNCDVRTCSTTPLASVCPYLTTFGNDRSFLSLKTHLVAKVISSPIN